MKKRLLAFLLAVSIAVSMLVMPASAAGNNTAVQFAITLGAMDSEQSGALNAAVTRGAFARMLTSYSTYRESVSSQGAVGTLYTDLPGSSALFRGGIVSYTNAVKAGVLGVPQTLLDQYGAVSPQVAEAMARGAKAVLGCDIALSTTGVAGPGPDGDKPAGLVYVGLRIPASLTADHAEVLKAVELHLDGMREEVRRLTVFHVLQNLSLFTASFKE